MFPVRGRHQLRVQIGKSCIHRRLGPNPGCGDHLVPTVICRCRGFHEANVLQAIAKRQVRVSGVAGCNHVADWRHAALRGSDGTGTVRKYVGGSGNVDSTIKRQSQGFSEGTPVDHERKVDRRFGGCTISDWPKIFQATG